MSRLPRPQLALDIQASPREPSRTVLVLANACAGNVPLDEHPAQAQTTTRITWHVDFATADAGRFISRPYDVAFNAIGNADLLDEAYELPQPHSPPANTRPEPSGRRRKCTRRDRLPHALLDGIPDIDRAKHHPALACAQAEPAPVLAADLNAAGMVCPVLIRTDRRARRRRRVPIARDRRPRACMPTSPARADAYYAIAYHDVRQARRTFHRKYRTVFIDRKPYPYHLAISDHWLVHYFSASHDVRAHGSGDEEQSFPRGPECCNPRAFRDHIGDPHAIGERLDLDFAAIDYAAPARRPRAGLFEANATMLVHLRDPIATTSPTSTCTSPRSSKPSKPCWTATPPHDAQTEPAATKGLPARPHCPKPRPRLRP